MALVNNCPKCATKLSVDDSLAGKKVRCPKCMEVFTMMGPEALPVAQIVVTPVEKPPQVAPIRAVRPPLPQAIPQPVAQRVAPPPLPPSTEITSGLPAFNFRDEQPGNLLPAKKTKEASKKPPLAVQIVGIIGGIGGAILGRTVGLPVLIVVVLAAMVGTPLYFLTSGARRRMVFAGALQGGHALWILVGVVLIAAGTVPGVSVDPVVVIEAVLFFAGAILVVLLPYLPVIILMTVYQTVGLAFNVMTLSRGVPVELRKALFLHMFLRVLAVAMMFLAYFEKPKVELEPLRESPPDDDFEQSPRQRPRGPGVPLGMILGITLGAIVVVSGIIAGYLAFRGSEPNPQVHKGPVFIDNPPDNNPQDNQPAVRNWQAFTPPDGAFTVDFPGVPKHTSRRADNTNRTVHVYEFDEGKDNFQVITLDPPLRGRPPQLFQTLRGLRSTFDLGKIEPEKPISLGTYKGYEFTIQFSNRTFVERTIHGHGRDFTLRVSAPHFQMIARDADRFFNSFRPEGMDRGEKLVKNKPSNQQRPRIFEGAGSDIMFLAFDRDGKTVSAACQNGELRVWSIESGFTRSNQEFPRQPVRFLAFAQSQDGKTTAACTLGGQYYFLDPAAFKPKTILQDKLTPQFIWSLAVSADGKMAAAGHDNKTVVWNTMTLGPQWSLSCKGRVNSLAFSPDGKILAAGTKNNTIHLWDPRGGQDLKPLVGKAGGVPSAGALWALTFSPDNKTLAAGGNDHTVRVWDLSTRTERALLRHDDTVRSLAISPDGKKLAAGDDAGNVTLWELPQTNRKAFFSADNRRQSVRALAFSGDSAILAGGSGNEVRLWDMNRVRWDDAPGN
jgi:predicted Zn finger-like uncharacterized protein